MYFIGFFNKEAKLACEHSHQLPFRKYLTNMLISNQIWFSSFLVRYSLVGSFVLRLYPTSRIFQDYEKALELAKMILQRYSYNLNNIQNQDTIITPPYWIDMSKLFKLYVCWKS